MIRVLLFKQNVTTKYLGKCLALNFWFLRMLDTVPGHNPVLTQYTSEASASPSLPFHGSKGEEHPVAASWCIVFDVSEEWSSTLENLDWAVAQSAASKPTATAFETNHVTATAWMAAHEWFFCNADFTSLYYISLLYIIVLLYIVCRLSNCSSVSVSPVSSW